MKDNYSFDNAVLKDYSKDISDYDKLKIMLDAYKAATKMTNDELKKEVECILAYKLT